MPREHNRPGTPPPLKKSQEDRDLAAIKRRHETLQETDAIVEDHREHGDITRPTDVSRMRYESDPPYRELWDRHANFKAEVRHALQKLASETLEIHQNVDPKALEELQREVGRITHSLAISKWILGFLIAATLGSIVVVATKIFTWGYSSGELEIRMKHMERDIERLQNSRKTQYPNFFDSASKSIDSTKSTDTEPKTKEN